MNVKKDYRIVIIYFALYLIAALTIALNQPLKDTYPFLCNPPDEHSRYMVPLYICENGTLPTGFEEELFSGECRWTYGFYTLLPYMIQGYAMRFVSLFTKSALALLYTARLVNVMIGLLTALMTLKIGKQLFIDKRIGWMFCFFVTFLPQSLFLHTYVNPDSLCLLSVAFIVYGMITGLKEGFSWKPCAFLTAGIILCALTYYNAYGFIFSSIFIFIAGFIYKNQHKWEFSWREFCKKGAIMAIIVLLCISWSFVRNYLLYDGDFIGLTTKENFIKSFGIVRESYLSQGKSLFTMLAGTAFLPKMLVSFIACYGSSTMYTWWIVYIFYLLLIGAGILGMLFYREMNSDKKYNWKRKFLYLNLLFCILVTLLLAIRYSYTVDFQPQGRYLMPALIPILYFVCHGLEKLPLWTKATMKGKKMLQIAVMSGIVFSLMITVFVTALPVYQKYPVL